MIIEIDPKVIIEDSGIAESIATLLASAVMATQETGRSSSVSLKISIKFDADSCKTVARGKVTATWPDGDDDARTRKLPGVHLLSIRADHPGQQRIDQ